MKVVFFISTFLIFLLFSCVGKNDNSVITFRIEKSDFIEKITVPGTVQAVVNTPVMPPRIGQMTVTRLAQDGEYVKTGDTICVLSAPELVLNYEQMLTLIETLEAELKKSEADNQLNIALLEAQLLTSEASLKMSYLDTLQLKYATEVRQKLLALEMERSTIEKQKIEKKLAASGKIGESDLKQKRLRIMQQKIRAQSYADQINSLTLIAQRDGIVQRGEAPIIMLMSARGSGTFGGPIKEGSVLMFPSPVLQFPDLSQMQISADVSESAFKKIEKGQRVVITVDAAKKLETTGRVNRKSLASSNAQRYSASQVKSYEVIVDVDSCHTKMKPGLSASCEIFLREEKDTLFVPSLSIFERDSAKVVYVKDRKKFIPFEIKTGVSGSSYTIISAGLKGDEIIALSKPPFSLIAEEIVRIDTTTNTK
jgi:multidrug efflux pump subunit AcrA (membrane-fusion protein)